MQWKPNVTVASIVERQGRFLIVEEWASGELVLNQPAGHLEKGECLIDAVKRETLEETAWHFEPQAATGIYLYPSPRNEITYLRVCFHGRCYDHQPNLSLDDAIVRTLWLSRAELEMMQDRLRSPMVLQCIDDYLNGNRIPLEFITHQLGSDISLAHEKLRRHQSG